MDRQSRAFTAASLEAAWERVRANGGAAGVDGISIGQFEAESGLHLAALAEDLASGAYRPQLYRSVDVPKPGGGRRRLVIATLRDRVAQTAATACLQPLIEPMFHPCSYAYRPGRSVHDALAKVVEYRNRGFSWVLRSDIDRFFDSVPHAPLLSLLASTEAPPMLVEWIRVWLSNGLAVDGECIPIDKGIPQGLAFSPLLANLYLTSFDRYLVDRGFKLVRYADDFLVCCESEAEAARARLMEQFGTRVQESVFECWLDDHARRSLDESLTKVLKSPPDNVRFYPLCADCRKTALEGGTQIAENVSFYIV